MASPFSTRTFCEWNTDDPVPADAAFGVRLNIVSKRRIAQLVDCGLRGIPVYILFGTEVDGAGYDYTEDGLRLFLGLYHAHITALTIRNEWNRDKIPYDQVRAENAWAHKVCKGFNIPFAISSNLVQDWEGPITGFGLYGEWPGLTSLYQPGEVDGEYVDLHLYSYGGPAHLRAMLDFYTDYGYKEPIIVGEFGTVFGPDIPVRAMFDAVLSHPSVAMACLFAAERGGPDASQDYAIRRKPAWDEFIQYANEHKEEEKPMPTYPPVVFCFRPSTQEDTAVFDMANAVPPRHDLAKKEYPMQRWLGNAKIGPYALRKHPEWFVWIYDQIADKSGSVLQVRSAYDTLIRAAKANPNSLFIAVDGHTDSGTTPHYGFRVLGNESWKLAHAIRDEFFKFWKQDAAFFTESPGYIAVGGAAGLEFPPNLVGVICEEDIHTNAEAILRWVQNSDATAQAIVDGVAAYVASLQVVPVDWQKRAGELEIEVARLKHVGQSEAAELDMIAASLRAAADRLATVAKELKA